MRCSIQNRRFWIPPFMDTPTWVIIDDSSSCIHPEVSMVFRLPTAQNAQPNGLGCLRARSLGLFFNVAGAEVGGELSGIYIYILYIIYYIIYIYYIIHIYIYIYIYMGLGLSINGGTPKIDGFIMENPFKMDEFRYPYFRIFVHGNITERISSTKRSNQ